MSARSELYCALMTGGSHSPSPYLASRRIDAFRDEVLRAEIVRVPSHWECMNGTAEDEPFCEEGDVHGDTDCPMVRVHRDDVEAFGALVDKVHELEVENRRLQNLTSAWRDQLIKVEGFCAKRAEYITAILNCRLNDAADYHRWQGHAESRRELSELMGLPTAWPASGDSPAHHTPLPEGDDRS